MIFNSTMTASPTPETLRRRCSGAETTPPKVAELVQQRPRQRFDVAAGDGAEEDKLKQFVVGHRVAPALHEARAQTGAVIANSRMAGARPAGRGGRLVRGKEGQRRLAQVGMTCHGAHLRRKSLTRG